MSLARAGANSRPVLARAKLHQARGTGQAHDLPGLHSRATGCAWLPICRLLKARPAALGFIMPASTRAATAAGGLSLAFLALGFPSRHLGDYEAQLCFKVLAFARGGANAPRPNLHYQKQGFHIITAVFLLKFS